MNEILMSQDGSHTVKSSKFDSTYHSIHGAFTESRVVYIETGLQYLLDKGYRSIHLFEMGFGSGLNALLSLDFALTNKCHIAYTGIERYPLVPSEFEKLNYCSLSDLNNLSLQFLTMHSSSSDETLVLNEFFTFTKIIGDIEKVELSERFDVIFFDAFSPGIQDMLWGPDVMKMMYGSLNPHGVLTTYCAQGKFRRVLTACGFKVEKLPGPPGKREITRAIKE